MTIGELIQHHLNEHRLSMAELSRRVGCGHSSVSRWVSGERNPDRAHTEELCRVFGLYNEQRIRFLATAGHWPFDEIPSWSTASKLNSVMANQCYRESVQR